MERRTFLKGALAALAAFTLRLRESVELDVAPEALGTDATKGDIIDMVVGDSVEPYFTLLGNGTELTDRVSVTFGPAVDGQAASTEEIRMEVINTGFIESLRMEAKDGSEICTFGADCLHFNTRVVVLGDRVTISSGLFVLA